MRRVVIQKLLLSRKSLQQDGVSYSFSLTTENLKVHTYLCCVDRLRTTGLQVFHSKNLINQICMPKAILRDGPAYTSGSRCACFDSMQNKSEQMQVPGCGLLRIGKHARGSQAGISRIWSANFAVIGASAAVKCTAVIKNDLMCNNVLGDLLSEAQLDVRSCSDWLQTPKTKDTSSPTGSHSRSCSSLKIFYC